MATFQLASSRGLDEQSWRQPWLWLGLGLGCCLTALTWLLVLGETGQPARPLLIFLGLLAAGAGIVLRPRDALVLASAGLTGFLAWLAMGPWPDSGVPWDSARYLMVFLTGVAGIAAVVVLLPRLVQRVIISAVIVFHFTGILSTVFSVPPSPWMATNLWTYVYRPYLDFMYLNNAYHFYSPDPGPPNLLWFRLEYEDGSKRWYMIPNRDHHPTSVNYQRRLSLTESTFPGRMTEPTDMLRRQQRRADALLVYPFHPGIPESAQFREPGLGAKRNLASFARWVAQNDPLAETPRKVVKVRVYRVIHDILEGRDLAFGHKPTDLWRYRPHYQGEFNAEGELLNPNDPLLYWLIPIVRKDSRTGWEHPNTAAVVKVEENDHAYEIYDFFRLHAGEYYSSLRPSR